MVAPVGVEQLVEVAEVKPVEGGYFGALAIS